MAEQLTPQTPDLDVWASSLAHCFLRQGTLLHFVSLHPARHINGYQRHTAGGNPAMDLSILSGEEQQYS